MGLYPKEGSMHHDRVTFSGQCSVVKMILNPGNYQGTRWDEVVDLSLVRVKYPIRKSPGAQDIIPVKINHEIEDKDLDHLCTTLEVELIDPMSLALSHRKNPSLTLPLFTRGADESGFYFGGRGYQVKLDIDLHGQRVIQAEFRFKAWPAGTTFACVQRGDSSVVH